MLSWIEDKMPEMDWSGLSWKLDSLVDHTRHLGRAIQLECHEDPLACLVDLDLLVLGSCGLLILIIALLKCRRQSPPELRKRSLHDNTRLYPSPSLPLPSLSRPRLNTSTTVASLAEAVRMRRLPLETAEEEDEDPLALWPSTQHYRFFGPAQTTLTYATLTPPMSWSEASRYVLPIDYRRPLERELALNVAALTLSLLPPSASQHPHTILTLPVADLSLHVHDAEGGVVQLYVKESSREEWMEHTFLSASDAAQFQTDLVAAQWLGPSIAAMYQALRICHQGSCAFQGQEWVYHDDTLDDTGWPRSTGIAWDDAMRCLAGTFPAMAAKLEALWWTKATHSSVPQTRATKQVVPKEEDSKEEAANLDSLTDEYVGKRLMLGPIDFFRLFVPTLPAAAVPLQTSSKARVEQLLRWRKRVARAAVLVQAYCQARKVVNRGWNLLRPLPEKHLRRRLAFDDNMDNRRHDFSTENEYYEATVSRDIVCQVRGHDSLRQRPWWLWGAQRSSPTMSLPQGYALVGVHVFQRPSDYTRFPLRPEIDPVAAIPSLQAMIQANPEQHFFVKCFYPEERPLITIAVFVRSLPTNIDPSFDTVVDKFVHGTKEERDAMIMMFVQLGTYYETLSWSFWLVLVLLPLVHRFSSFGSTLPRYTSSIGDRTPLPPVAMAECGTLHQFGGALQTDENMPKNYVGYTLHIDPIKSLSLVIRLYLGIFVQEGLRNEVVDFTFVLAGGKSNELPERALGTYRVAHANLRQVSLPMSYLAPSFQENDQRTIETTIKTQARNLYFRVLVTDTFLATVSPLAKMFSSRFGGTPEENVTQSRRGSVVMGQVASIVDSPDIMDRAVNELIGILRLVEVPVRKEQLGRGYDTANRVAPNEDMIKVPILHRVTRSDLRRFFVATGCSLKKTAVRVVESAAWRGLTFPIDTRVCRVELQNGQFFQQGMDKLGNPVFYFRNMLRGPWRRDEDAVVAAVLHRLEAAFAKLRTGTSDCKCTLVVLMGKPYKDRKQKTMHEVDGDESDDGDADEANDNSSNAVDEAIETVGDADTVVAETEIPAYENNPRVDALEQYQVHTNKKLVRTLIHLVMDNYPERLHRVCIVWSSGNTAYGRTIAGASVRLPKYVHSARTRDKIRFLRSYADLKGFIDKEQLVTIAGGTAAIDPNAFECKPAGA